MRILIFALAASVLLAFGSCTPSGAPGPVFHVSFPDSLSSQTFDGRLLVMLSKDSTAEPRFQISDGPNTQIVFGMDVEGMEPGDLKRIDARSFGYPMQRLSEIPPGDYYVQALLHVYETFKRSDGHTVKLPMDNGEGQQWNRSPGNLYSTPQKMTLNGYDSKGIVQDKIIPPLPEPEDTE
ncbi:MAG: hypothetical protein AAFQ98_22840, partial [Bacteroidota bacterium]